MKPTDLKRFLEKINKTATCWLWTGGKQKGYGAFHLNGRMQPAHRVYYSHNFGEIPQGKEIDHTCFKKECVNPYHLEAVSPSVNTRRGKLNAGQVKHTYVSDVVEYCKHGHKRNTGNTYEHSKGRTCRVCQLASVAKYSRRVAI